MEVIIISRKSAGGRVTPVAAVGVDRGEAIARWRPWVELLEVCARFPGALGPTDLYKSVRLLCRSLTNGWSVFDPEAEDFMETAGLTVSETVGMPGSDLGAAVDRVFAEKVKGVI